MLFHFPYSVTNRLYSIIVICNRIFFYFCRTPSTNKLPSMKKTCPECGEEIKGRSDKKFCSDPCRNSFNNKLNSDTTNLIRNVNNILRKNRRVLEELTSTQKAKASKTKLMQKGFNFQYYTNAYTTKKGSTYYFCYEYGYLPLDNDFCFLLKRKEYSEQ